MTVSIFLLILVMAILILMGLIIKIKMHPVLALFLTALGLGIALGNGLTETVALINSSFGGTLAGVGITIILGSILAMGIQDTGAATSIANFFIKLFRGKKMELAPALTAFIVSIPVFGDITMVLTAPIASVLSIRRKISMSTMAAFTGLGLFLTHGLVPPTPGILAISIMYGADLGMVIFWGIVVSAIAFFGTWLILRRWTEKEWISPRENFILGVETAKSDKVNDLIIQEKNLPNAFSSMLPILIPVVLITLASFSKVYLPEGSATFGLFTTIGDKVLALLAGVIFTFVLGKSRKDKIIKNNEIALNEPCDNVREIMLNKWVTRGLTVALLPLLITAMGGAVGGVLKAAPVIEELGTIVTSSSILPVLVPFLAAAILMTAVGSMTTAGLTAAAIILPMLEGLGLSPEAAVLSIGAGTMMVNHVNNSGFWIMTQFFNLDTKQGIKYVTIPTMVAALISIAVLTVFVSLGLI